MLPLICHCLIVLFLLLSLECTCSVQCVSVQSVVSCVMQRCFFLRKADARSLQNFKESEKMLLLWEIREKEEERRGVAHLNYLVINLSKV